MACIGDLTSPRMLAYANRHGYDFHCTRNIRPGEHYWQKIWDALQFIHIYDRIIYLDADQVVTNMDFVPPWFTGFQASLDWGTDAVDESCFSACGFIIGRDMHRFLEDMKELYSEYRSAEFPEQSAMRKLYREGKDYSFRMRTHPRRVFNAVPKEICPEAPDPWQRGDWCAHLTHIEMSARAELFNTIVQQADS